MKYMRSENKKYLLVSGCVGMPNADSTPFSSIDKEEILIPGACIHNVQLFEDSRVAVLRLTLQ